MMLHIEDLVTEVQLLQSACLRSIRDGNLAEIATHQSDFKAFCDRHNLPIDFTDRHS